MFKADKHDSIEQVLHNSQYFPEIISEEDNSDLMEEVSEEELKETPHSFHNDKILGQDEWIIEFFSTTYDTIGPNFLQLVEEYQVNGPLHHPLNTTFLALIPKKYNMDSMEYFRLVSLCNITYKVVTNVITQRLKVF